MSLNSNFSFLAGTNTFNILLLIGQAAVNGKDNENAKKGREKCGKIEKKNASLTKFIKN